MCFKSCQNSQRGLQVTVGGIIGHGAPHGGPKRQISVRRELKKFLEKYNAWNPGKGTYDMAKTGADEVPIHLNAAHWFTFDYEVVLFATKEVRCVNPMTQTGAFFDTKTKRWKSNSRAGSHFGNGLARAGHWEVLHRFENGEPAHSVRSAQPIGCQNASHFWNRQGVPPCWSSTWRGTVADAYGSGREHPRLICKVKKQCNPVSINVYQMRQGQNEKIFDLKVPNDLHLAFGPALHKGIEGPCASF